MLCICWSPTFGIAIVCVVMRICSCP